MSLAIGLAIGLVIGLVVGGFLVAVAYESGTFTASRDRGKVG